MDMVRRIGAVALLAAAIAVWFGMAPDSPDNSKLISSIESGDDANNTIAEGAPQQAVVNGWTNLEYLHLISKQLDEASSAEVRDDRPEAMLGLCVAGIALLALTNPSLGTTVQPRRVERSSLPVAVGASGAPQ